MTATRSKVWAGIALSAAGHMGLGILVGELRMAVHGHASHMQPVEVVLVATPPVPVDPVPPTDPNPEEAPLEGPPEVATPTEMTSELQEPPPPAPAPEAAPAPRRSGPSTSASASTDPPQTPPTFGLRLEGGDIGAPGIAVPVGDGLDHPRTPSEEPPTRRVARPAPSAAAHTQAQTPGRARASSSTTNTCDDEPTRPVPTRTPQPVYTDAARSAGIEGRVRVRVTVSPAGVPTHVEVLEGLGFGLDEASIEAVLRWQFEPSLACGSAVESTFVARLTFRA